MKIYHYTIGTMLALTLNSCVQEVEQKTDTVESANEINDKKPELKEDEDFEFVSRTASTGMMEVQLSKLAIERAQTKEVKSLAQKIAEDHSLSNAELLKIAATKKITLPEGLSKEDKEMIEETNKKTGMDFDKEYVEKMIKSHKSAIENFEDAAEHCEDPDIKSFASSSLHRLKMHLDMSKEAEKKIKDKKNKYD